MVTEDRQTGSQLPWRQMIGIDRVQPNPHNPRVDLGNLDELERSIRKRGLEQPITVYPRPGMDGYYWIQDGERRFRAMEGWNTQIPAVVKPLRPGETMLSRDLLSALVTGTMQKPLNAIERAKTYQRLMNEAPGSSSTGHMTQREIAEQVGLTDTTINTYLMLNELAPQTQDDLISGKITFTEAIRAIRQHRAAVRRRKGQKKMAPVWEPPWFSSTHPLAGKAADRCNRLAAIGDHGRRRRIGRRGKFSGACGKCWQAVAETEAEARILERCAGDIRALAPDFAARWQQESQTLRK